MPPRRAVGVGVGGDAGLGGALAVGGADGDGVAAGFGGCPGVGPDDPGGVAQLGLDVGFVPGVAAVGTDLDFADAAVAREGDAGEGLLLQLDGARGGVVDFAHRLNVGEVAPTLVGLLPEALVIVVDK